MTGSDRCRAPCGCGFKPRLLRLTSEPTAFQGKFQLWKLVLGDSYQGQIRALAFVQLLLSKPLFKPGCRCQGCLSGRCSISTYPISRGSLRRHPRLAAKLARLNPRVAALGATSCSLSCRSTSCWSCTRLISTAGAACQRSVRTSRKSALNG